MRKLWLISLSLSLALPGLAQSKAAPKKPAAQKPATATPATPGANPVATIETSEGNLVCELYKDKVPGAVANFVGLATGTKDWTDPKTGVKKHGVPLYNGTIFHRVIPEFMIQGGDPSGDGTGMPLHIPDEFTPDLKFDKPGVLAYANIGRPNTSGSQFFITEVAYPFLDPCLDEAGCIRGNRQVPKGYGYVAFGQCTPESVELVKKIAREPSNPENNRPANPVVIKRITFTGIQAPKPAAKRPVHRTTPGAKKPVAKPKP